MRDLHNLPGADKQHIHVYGQPRQENKTAVTVSIGVPSARADTAHTNKRKMNVDVRSLLHPPTLQNETMNGGEIV